MSSSTTTELAKYEGSSMDERMEYARMIATAGDLVPSGFHDPLYREGPNGTQLKVAGQVGPVNPGKVFLAFEYGAMLGLHPLAALMGIHVIEGKPAASAGLISSLVRTAGHRLRVTTTGNWDDGTFEAVAELTRSDDPDFTFRAVWTKRDAERAGLLGKDNWVKYPGSMSKARAITAVAREGAEEALLGVHYTPEELGAAVDANGEVLVLEEGEPREGGGEAEEAKPARKTPARGTQGTKRRAKAAPVDMTPPADSDEADRDAVRPEEEIVEAEVVEMTPEEEAEADERLRRAQEAEEAEARHREEDPPEVTPESLAKLRDARMPDAQPGESEVDYQQRKLAEKATAKAATQENVARPFVDTYDGSTYATQEELDAVLAARVKAKQAERAQAAPEAPSEPQGAAEPDPFPTPSPEPDAFDLAYSEEPDNYERQAKAAVTEEQVKDVWNRATEAKAMTSELRLLIIREKNRVSPPEGA